VIWLILTRALLFALPFAVYFVWRAVARRHGHEMGATPWTWLGAAGVVLLTLSLMATVFFREETRGKTYVPAQAEPGGRVRPSEFRPTVQPEPSSTAPNTAP
jgi:heme/copper-type cytochrome/quinol oxidase subunit 3